VKSSSTPPTRESRTIPLWSAFVLFAFVWGVLPWAISLLSPRYGWQSTRLSLWNLLGLILLLAGLAGSLYTLQLHARGPNKGVDMEPDKAYLLTTGPYAYSRNPMYLFELVLMFGWVLFYGSLAVLLAFLAWAAFFAFYQVPSEERTIEAHFGENYRAYKMKVPRWFGRPHS
jgi:protein-S-isoprenylcysteine O-methyltransferase Ste14